MKTLKVLLLKKIQQHSRLMKAKKKSEADGSSLCPHHSNKIPNNSRLWRKEVLLLELFLQATGAEEKWYGQETESPEQNQKAG